MAGGGTELVADLMSWPAGPSPYALAYYAGAPVPSPLPAWAPPVAAPPVAAPAFVAPAGPVAMPWDQALWSAPPVGVPPVAAPPVGAVSVGAPLDDQLALLRWQLTAIAAQIDAILAVGGPASPWPAPVLPPPGQPAPAPGQPSPTPSQPSPTRPKTTFVISSFNVLGSSHTVPGGERPGMAPGTTRIREAARLLDAHDVDVVGFQEFQGDQMREFMRVAGDEYAVYPGFALGRKEVVNSIAWRKETWDLVAPGSIAIPYFDGTRRQMPVVRLRHKGTGQEAYFANFHNPASTRKHPGQQRWRDEATAKEIALVNRLIRESGLPVFVVGDMNEREEYYTRLTRGAPMVAANAGPGGKAPRKMGIDWIFGSRGVSFSDFVRDRGARVRRTSDHPMIVSRARIG